MGKIRKLTSVSTLGLVGFRSDKERMGKNAKRTQRNTQAMAAEAHRQTLEAIRQTQLLAQLAARQQTLPPPGATAAIVAGWHADPLALARLRYHDGTKWTEQTAD